MKSMSIVILGLSITSSWGNGHATTYRGLVRALVRRGHKVLFLERNVPWYTDNRDLPSPAFGRTCLYRQLDELRNRFFQEVAGADLVIVGSYVPEGAAVCEWVLATAGGKTAFYDIDTPVTLAGLARGDVNYLHTVQIPRFDMYLSFSGGPTLQRLEEEYGSPMARPLYCSADPEHYFPEPVRNCWDLGYLGTYSPDRQAGLAELLHGPARRWQEGKFIIAGPQFPDSRQWPANVKWVPHLPPSQHRSFYNGQRFTLNITRSDMVMAGWSPSVRLFEAAACGVPVISDWWEGLDFFFSPDQEILISDSAEQTLDYLQNLSEGKRKRLAVKARRRILAAHTAAHRAAELEQYMASLLKKTWFVPRHPQISWKKEENMSSEYETTAAGEAPKTPVSAY